MTSIFRILGSFTCRERTHDGSKHTYREAHQCSSSEKSVSNVYTNMALVVIMVFILGEADGMYMAMGPNDAPPLAAPGGSDAMYVVQSQSHPHSRGAAIHVCV